MNPLDIPVLILFGPTASGKTDILRELFISGKSGLKAEVLSPRCGDFDLRRRSSGLKAEIVSADSMQVYRGMDIGTAKPSAEERVRLPHHLIDIRAPDEQFNTGDFCRLADEACQQIADRGKLPVVSGGAGFYLKNFIMGLSDAPPSDEAIRVQLKQELKEKGAGLLMEELAACDPVSAGRIHINDEYRLLRALEVQRLTSRPLSSFQVNAVNKRAGFRFLIIGLKRPREELYRRIDLRCAEMFSQGLAGEVRALFEAGYTPNDPGLRAIGYREFFFRDDADKPGEWKLSENADGVQELAVRNSRRYAKRQITFFASIPGVKWIQPDNNEAETAERIKRELEVFL